MYDFSMGMLIGGALGVFSCLLVLNAYLLWKNLATNRRKLGSANSKPVELKSKANVKKGTVPLPNGLAMTSGSISNPKKTDQ